MLRNLPVNSALTLTATTAELDVHLGSARTPLLRRNSSSADLRGSVHCCRAASSSRSSAQLNAPPETAPAKPIGLTRSFQRPRRGACAAQAQSSVPGLSPFDDWAKRTGGGGGGGGGASIHAHVQKADTCSMRQLPEVVRSAVHRLLLREPLRHRIGWLCACPSVSAGAGADGSWGRQRAAVLDNDSHSPLSLSPEG